MRAIVGEREEGKKRGRIASRIYLKTCCYGRVKCRVGELCWRES